jgi:hypothetical protein
MKAKTMETLTKNGATKTLSNPETIAALKADGWKVVEVEQEAKEDVAEAPKRRTKGK